MDGTKVNNNAAAVKSGVYCIRNTKTNKVYIGSSQNAESRLNAHRNAFKRGDHKNVHLQRSFNKYGEIAFEFLIVEYVLLKELIEREQHWINHYDSYNKGYNLCPFAGTSRGRKWSKERHKHPHPNLGKKLSEETKRKIGQASIGRKHSEKTKKIISENLMGHPVSEETRKKIGLKNAKHQRKRWRKSRQSKS